MNLLTKQKKTHRLRKWIYSCQGKETAREFGKIMYTLLYLKWITNKDLFYSAGSSVQHYVAAWMRMEVWGRMDTCICMTESLCYSPETITALLIGCTPK